LTLYLFWAASNFSSALRLPKTSLKFSSQVS